MRKAPLQWPRCLGSRWSEEEKVPETADVQKTMGSMITLDGATLLFPTSFGYFDPHVLKVATQYPKVTFLHAGGLYQEGCDRSAALICHLSVAL
jgi:simple sugar transport system substrate-binding protein